MRKSSEKKKSIVPLRALIMYLFVCTLVLTGVTFSKYVHTVSGGDNARVAKFSVTADVSEFAETFTIELYPGMESDDFDLIVENDSETAVKLTAAIETEGNLPLKVTYQKGDEGEKLLAAKNENDFSFSFTDDLPISQGGNYKIWVTWDDSDKGDMYIYSNGVSAVRLTVRAEQID